VSNSKQKTAQRRAAPAESTRPPTRSDPIAIRRLASVPLPLEGESFLSWLDTCAIAMGESRIGVVTRMDLRLRGAFTPTQVESTLRQDRVARLVTWSGLTEREIAAMFLERFARTALPGVASPQTDTPRRYRTWAQEAWVRSGYSAWCPACLRENGGRWLLKWRLPMSFLCVKHGVYLVERCPECGEILDHERNTGSPLRSVCPSTKSASDQDRKRKARPAPRATDCGARLDEAAPPSARNPDLIEFQCKFDEWISSDEVKPHIDIPYEVGSIVEEVLHFASTHVVDLPPCGVPRRAQGSWRT
jgi:hypothetical protein